MLRGIVYFLLFMMVKAEGYVFDLDGTVLNTMPAHLKAWTLTGEEFGFIFRKTEFHMLAGKPTRAILEILCQNQGIEDIDIEAAVDRKQELYCSLLDTVRPIEPVLDIAKEAKEQGYPIAIATGSTVRQAYAALCAAGLVNFFNVVVTSEDVTNFKPHPETFIVAAERIGVPPNRCIGYEDTPQGLLSIQSAGFLEAVDVTKLPGYPK